MSLSKIDNFIKDVKQTKEIYIKNWKTFKMSNLFDIGGTVTTSINKIKGAPGNYPYVTTQATNNGVKLYSSIYTEKGNVLVVDSAVLGWMSYQENNFSASDHVEKLTPKFKLNKEIGLFIISVWNAIYPQKIFNYKRKANQKAIKDCVLPLPIDKSGNPDWEYMEEYIKTLSNKNLNFKKLEDLSKTIKIETKINTKDWKEYSLIKKWTIASGKIQKENNSGIFLLQATLSGLDHNKLINTDKQEFRLITRSDKNNGVARKVGKQKKPIDEGNCLTIGLDTQTIFYQDENFYTGQNINILRHEKLNKYSGLFMCGLLSQLLKNEFIWGSKGATLGRLMELTIKLPTKNNEPDFEFMEQYIKNIYVKIERSIV